MTASVATIAPAAPVTQLAVINHIPVEDWPTPSCSAWPRSATRKPSSVTARPTATAAPSRIRAGPASTSPRASAHPAANTAYRAA